MNIHDEFELLKSFIYSAICSIRLSGSCIKSIEFKYLTDSNLNLNLFETHNNISRLIAGYQSLSVSVSRLIASISRLSVAISRLSVAISFYQSAISRYQFLSVVCSSYKQFMYVFFKREINSINAE